MTSRTNIRCIPGSAVVRYEVRIQERVSCCGDITDDTGT